MRRALYAIGAWTLASYRTSSYRVEGGVALGRGEAGVLYRYRDRYRRCMRFEILAICATSRTELTGVATRSLDRLDSIGILRGILPGSRVSSGAVACGASQSTESMTESSSWPRGRGRARIITRRMPCVQTAAPQMNLFSAVRCTMVLGCCRCAVVARVCCEGGVQWVVAGLR